MLTVETIRKVRLANHRDEKSIRRIARDFNIVEEHRKAGPSMR